eukprot:Hpha_TRINITY_DN15584_c1_g11::TRINITY_DN15584_c1_g11_i2::g.107504::m.107504
MMPTSPSGDHFGKRVYTEGWAATTEGNTSRPVSPQDTSHKPSSPPSSPPVKVPQKLLSGIPEIRTDTGTTGGVVTQSTLREAAASIGASVEDAQRIFSGIPKANTMGTGSAGSSPQNSPKGANKARRGTDGSYGYIDWAPGKETNTTEDLEGRRFSAASSGPKRKQSGADARQPSFGGIPQAETMNFEDSGVMDDTARTQTSHLNTSDMEGNMSKVAAMLDDEPLSLVVPEGYVTGADAKASPPTAKQEESMKMSAKTPSSRLQITPPSQLNASDKLGDSLSQSGRSDKQVVVTVPVAVRSPETRPGRPASVLRGPRERRLNSTTSNPRAPLGSTMSRLGSTVKTPTQHEICLQPQMISPMNARGNQKRSVLAFTQKARGSSPRWGAGPSPKSASPRRGSEGAARPAVSSSSWFTSPVVPPAAMQRDTVSPTLDPALFGADKQDTGLQTGGEDTGREETCPSPFASQAGGSPQRGFFATTPHLGDTQFGLSKATIDPNAKTIDGGGGVISPSCGFRRRMSMAAFTYNPAAHNTTIMVRPLGSRLRRWRRRRSASLLPRQQSFIDKRLLSGGGGSADPEGQTSEKGGASSYASDRSKRNFAAPVFHNRKIGDGDQRKLGDMLKSTCTMGRFPSVSHGGFRDKVKSFFVGRARPTIDVHDATVHEGEAEECRAKESEDTPHLQADGWFCLESSIECYNCTFQAYHPDIDMPFAEPAKEQWDPGEDICHQEMALQVKTQWFDDGSILPTEFYDPPDNSECEWVLGRREGDECDEDVLERIKKGKREVWGLMQCFLAGSEHATRRLLPALFEVDHFEQRQGCLRSDVLVGTQGFQYAGRSRSRVWAGTGVWEDMEGVEPLVLPRARMGPWAEARQNVERFVLDVGHDVAVGRRLDWAETWEELMHIFTSPLEEGGERPEDALGGALHEWWDGELREAGVNAEPNSPEQFFRSAAHIRGLLQVISLLPYEDDGPDEGADDWTDNELEGFAEGLAGATLECSVHAQRGQITYPYPLPGRVYPPGVRSGEEIVKWIQDKYLFSRVSACEVAVALRRSGRLIPVDAVGTTPPPFSHPAALWRVEVTPEPRAPPPGSPRVHEPFGVERPLPDPAEDFVTPQPGCSKQPVFPEAFGYRLEAVIKEPQNGLRALIFSSESRVVLSFRGTVTLENALLDARCCTRKRENETDDRIFADSDHRADQWVDKKDVERDERTGAGLACGCDWKRCARVFCLQFDKEAKAHDGFLGGWELMEEQVIEAVKRICPLSDPRPLYCTGHSLGGALAQVAAFFISWKVYNWTPDLSDEERRQRRAANIEKMVRAYVFSSPKVGNSLYRALYDLVVPETFVIGIRGDPVIAMPWGECTCTSWAHAGHKFILGHEDVPSWIVQPIWLDRRVLSWLPSDPRAHMIDNVGQQLNLVLDHLCEQWPHNKCKKPFGGLFKPGFEPSKTDEPTNYRGPWVPLPPEEALAGGGGDTDSGTEELTDGEWEETRLSQAGMGESQRSGVAK